MSKTYVPPAQDGTFSDPVSEVRFLLKDTNPGVDSLEDGEISYHLTRNDGDPRRAAVAAARDRSNYYATKAKVDKTIGPLRISKDYGALAASFDSLADELGGSGSSGVPTVIIGLPYGADSPPMFRLGMHDS